MDVREYITLDGENPFADWLFGLDKSLQIRVMARLTRLENGNFGDHKHLQDGVYELRATFGGGVRIYFGKQGNQVIILLGGGNKQRQQKDIRKAILLWHEYLTHQDQDG